MKETHHLDYLKIVQSTLFEAGVLRSAFLGVRLRGETWAETN